MDAKVRTTVMIVITVIIFIAFIFWGLVQGGVIFEANDSTRGYGKMISPFVHNGSNVFESGHEMRAKKWAFFTFTGITLIGLIASTVIGSTDPTDVKAMKSLIVSAQHDNVDDTKKLLLNTLKLNPITIRKAIPITTK